MNKELGVNIDHVATLRNARGESYPSLLEAAFMAQLGGADNITIHLREDRRHVKDHDLWELKRYIQCPLNLEIALTPEMIGIALELKPAVVTLVPEKREELTTEGGLNLGHNQTFLQQTLTKLRERGIKPSVFIEAELETVRAAADLGAHCVEFHTGQLCRLLNEHRPENELAYNIDLISDAAHLGACLGLEVQLGHGINYQNAAFVGRIENAKGAQIGHAIIARALSTGMIRAVSDMKAIINGQLNGRSGA